MGKPISYWAYRAGSRVARSLPVRTLPAVERVAGRLAPRLMPERARQVERNLARVYGPGLAATTVRRAASDTFASYAHYWLESFRLPDTPVEAIAAGITVEHLDRLDAALEGGKGAILALPHLGGWEWAAFYLTAVRGVAVSAVVEAVEPPELADWFVELRRSFGIDVIVLGPEAGAATLAALRQNRVLCLLCDRDLHGEGVEVEFFGERTTLPAGPATLALRTGAPLLPAAVYFDGRDHRGVVREALDTSRQGKIRADVQRVTDDLAAELETLIAAAPEQWHLLQPNWPSDRT